MRIKVLKQGKKYSLRLGEYGTYFHDNTRRKDLSNQDILELLEKTIDIEKVDKNDT